MRNKKKMYIKYIKIALRTANFKKLFYSLPSS